MKLAGRFGAGAETSVASHAEAWIETGRMERVIGRPMVASHAEAWIETLALLIHRNMENVASHAEAWIETLAAYNAILTLDGRLPRGGVD